ncbi:MAG TPA: hypothetical protein VGN00_18915 [Puia sp.]|jgi:hypothetical protein
MLIIHSVQKLLNTSRVQASLFISQPDSGQHLHSWYARLLATGYPGKMFVMYVHEPSMMAVICKGKTIQGTWETFRKRLELLLRKYQFPEAFIHSELSQAEGYTVSKTNSRSILGFMNQMAFEIEVHCQMTQRYDAISIDDLEGRMIDRIYQFGKRFHDYRTPLQYWEQEISLSK